MGTIEKLAQDINALQRGDRNSQLFYLACLKQIGRIGKRIYALQPSEELKKELINLHKKIQAYEFH